MLSPQVTFFEVTAAEESQLVARVPRDWQAQYRAAPLTDHPDAIAATQVLSIFVHSRIDAALLERAPQLRLIVTRSTGYDHIDLDACREGGIAVCNVPDYGTTTVAEHAFALLLAVTRKLLDAAGALRTGSVDMDALRGVDLGGKTLGIVGTGRIGRQFARMAQGFGLRLLAYDPYPDAQWATQNAVHYLPLAELLRQCDFVSIHCPASPQTFHLIDARALAEMKSGAILVNTARGSVIDSAALLQALEDGRLAGAGLDVLEDEACFRFPPCPTDNASLRINRRLLKHAHVVATPHIAFNTVEALQRLLATSVENIERFLSGSPQNRVA